MTRQPPRRRASTLPPNAPPELKIARLERRIRKLTSLLDVAKALIAERNFDHLLDTVLQESVKVVDAERGSLFIVSRDGKTLWSKIAHGTHEVIRLPVGHGIAGAVAATGKLLNIADAYADERFNQAVDAKSGFRTRNVLCVPMTGQSGDVVGVVQALNHEGGPFTEDDEEILLALGVTAGAAIENTNLYEDIERLFEGFVRASVTAIESRDPTTSGHSNRVASLCVDLLSAVPRSEGPYRHVVVGPREIREIRYAALLHDFGKVGVREDVLLKASKLFPHELEMLEARFEQARRAHRIRYVETRIERLRSGASPTEIADLERAIQAEWARVDGELGAMLDFVRRCNQPSVTNTEVSDRLEEIRGRRFIDLDGSVRAYLTEDEHLNLRIPRGSLNDEERREIESHVVHTFNFLQQIPWTADLARVPEIAHGHHEKLDGSGYPRGLPADRIPLPTRIMTIADIYDALTATDRPYKAAMPHDRALEILESERDRGRLDAELLRIFVEAGVGYESSRPTLAP